MTLETRRIGVVKSFRVEDQPAGECKQLRTATMAVAPGTTRGILDRHATDDERHADDSRQRPIDCEQLASTCTHACGQPFAFGR